MKSQQMTPLERRASYSLASIYSLRMMGLFMILPVFSLYADELVDSTPVLIGLAIGAYGLTQALFQIPFGMLSDRLGRKPVITFGLVVFALGSVVAANADTITGVILGRALQGSGAIAAAIMALTADLTREEHRTKAMAVIGMSIGLSFAVSLVLAPVLNDWIGVRGIFWLTALLALGGIFMLHMAVPQPVQSIIHRDAEPVRGYFAAVLRDTQLLRLDLGVFILHMILTASFVVLPFALRDYANIAVAEHWHIYLPVLLISMVVMVPLVVLAEKYRHIKQVYVAAIVLVSLGQLGLSLFYDSLIGVLLTLLLFFLAFNVLEALLPSLIVKFAPADKKGTAMGIYSTSQFSGAFIGGLVGGAVYGSFGLNAVFLFCAFMALIWTAVAATMQTPRYLSNFMLHIGVLDAARQQQMILDLEKMPGVHEVTIVAEEGAAYLKIDSRVADKAALEGFSCNDDGAYSDTGAAVSADSRV
jgi:MFS family permease